MSGFTSRCPGLQPSYDYLPPANSTGEFCMTVIQYFIMFLEETHIYRSADPSHLIRESFRYSHPYLGAEAFFEIYFEAVFSLFEVYPVPTSVVHPLLEEYALRTMVKYTRENRNSTRADLIYGFHSPDGTMETFDHPYLLQDMQAVQRVLRYGAHFEINADCLNLHLTSLLRSTTYTPLHLCNDNVAWVGVQHISHYQTLNERKRLYLILLMISAVVQKLKNLSSVHVGLSSLKLVFKTIPEPLVAVSEISKFLNICTACVYKERSIEEFCQKFVEELPKSGEPLGPRSLKHLCRCRVRKELSKSGTMPSGVRSLGIPNFLKNYLLLQRREDEFHPKFVTTLLAWDQFICGHRDRRQAAAHSSTD